MSASNPPITRRRLDSWKEIAAFFDRDERTVHRWEKERGLPVHRLPGAKGRVYAFSDELSAWLAAPKNADAAPSAQTPSNGHTNGHSALASSGLTVISGGRRSTDIAPPEDPSPQDTRTPPAQSLRKFVKPLAASLLFLAVVALTAFYLASRRSNALGSSAARSSAGAPAAESQPGSASADAEQLYLKGRYYWNQRTPDDLNKALDYFTQAIVHDPNYAPAYVGLADCYNLLREYSKMPASEAYPRALAAAKKAVQLDDGSSDAHASLAFVSFFGMWDIPTGLREFHRAIQLNPNSPQPHHWYANALLALWRLPEAVDEIDRAQALDPASSAILADKGNILASAGRTAEAIALLKQIEARDPSFRSPHLYLKYIYLRGRDYPNYLSEMHKDAVLMHDDSALAVADAAAKGYSAGGAPGMFRSMLVVQKKLYGQQQLPPTALAQTYASLGDKSEALHYLSAAYDQRDGALLFIQTYPEFDGLHSDPAYGQLLVRMNLPAQSISRPAPSKISSPPSAF
jgi:tetratricopeptide (TPR) repeat protein